MRKLACGLLLAAAAWLGCVAKTHPYEIEEPYIGAPGVERVGVLPLNVLVAMPPEFDDGTRTISRLVDDHLRDCGREVVSFGLLEARSLWSRAVEAAGGDPDAAMPHYVTALRAERPFDVLVMPSLVYREARIRPVTLDVDWDGVRRKLEVAGYVHNHGSLVVMPDIRGKMMAASLHLAAFDRSGVRVFDSYAGLDLVHEIDMGTPQRRDLHNRPAPKVWQIRLKRDRFGDRDALREGIALAFRPYLEPPLETVSSSTEAP